MSDTLPATPHAPRSQRRAQCLRVVASPDLDVVGTAVPLTGPPKTLGRTERAAVRFDDPRLSGVHASIRPGRRGEPASVADLDSRNGTFVDGRSAHRSELALNAVLRVGDTCLVVDDGGTEDDPEIRGTSAAIAALREGLAKVAPTTLRVLLLGATGTGKELAAGRVHALSGRRGPMIAVNCAAIPSELAESTLFGHTRGAFTGASSARPGLFREADSGTLFLDEVGELPLAIQGKLLRALEDGSLTPVGGSGARRVDVRVVAATNVDLEAAVREGAFRADLYARLAEWPVRLPTLAQRRVDVLHLARSFLPDRPLFGDAAEALLLHDWPFNVRELAQLCKRLEIVVGAGEPVGLEDLGDALAAPLVSRHRPADPRAELEGALRDSLGNVTRAAKLLGVSRRTLYRRIEELGVDPESFRA